MEKYKQNKELLSAYFVFQPLLMSERPMLTDAQKILDGFNRKNHTNFSVRDMLACTISVNDTHIIPTEPPHIICRAARLAIDDCNAALLRPENNHVKSAIQMKKNIAEVALKAFSPR